MNQERSTDTEKIVSYKSLLLIPPEAAQRFGFQVEEPIFISPRVRRSKLCGECNQDYGPLIYQTGAFTEAHHMHNTNGGGIYFRNETSIFPVHGNWFAILNPQGETVSEHEDGLGNVTRAQSVIVEEIKAFCPEHAFEELSEGIIASRLGSELKPFCTSVQPWKIGYEQKYRFKIEEGRVHIG